MASGLMSTKRCRDVSVGASLQSDVRRNGFFDSFAMPSRAPQGRQFLAALAGTGFPSASVPAGVSTQSHTPPAGHSASVGTPAPVCGTPMSWNPLSENSEVLWQSLQAALPANSFAPCWARGEIRLLSAPAATHLSKAELRLTIFVLLSVF